MSRTQRILTVLLGLQIALLLLVAAPWSAGSGAVASAVLLPELQSFAPAKIEVSHGDEKLVLSQDQGAWRIDQAGGYPADATKVQKLLDDLKQLQVRRPVVRSSRYHAALKVTESENERRLRLFEAGQDAPRLEVLIGSSANYGINHVRRADRQEVYEVRGLSPWDVRPEAGAWIDTKLVDVASENLRSIRLTNEHGTFELQRDDAGAWSVASPGTAGKALDPSAVDEFARSIGSLRLTRPAGRAEGAAEYGLDRPAARLELVQAHEGASSAPLELRIGAAVAGDSGERYARVAGSEFAVILSKWDAERILGKKLADLQQKS